MVKKIAKGKTLLIILGDQLYPIKYIKGINPDYIFMAEDYKLCTAHKYHKQKIVLYISSMRYYAEKLKDKSLRIIYKKLDNTDIFEAIKTTVKRKKITTIFI